MQLHKIFNRPFFAVLAIIVPIIFVELYINRAAAHFADFSIFSLAYLRLFILLAVIAPGAYFLMFLPLLRNMAATKKAEMDLRKSEEKYRSLLHEMNEGFCLIEVIFDDQGKAVNLRFMETSPEFEKQSGLKDATGKLMRDLEPGFEETWYQTYGRIARTGVAEHFERGSEALGRYFEVHAYPHGNPDDHQVAILFSDITRRIQAEKDLLQSEQRLRGLVSATSDAVYRMNPDWSEMNNLSGGKFLTSVGEPINDWLNHFIPVNFQPKVLAAIQKAISSKSMFELEHEVFRADGSVGWTFSRAIPVLGDHGEIVEWNGIASDITDRKMAEDALRKSEQRMSALIKATTNAIYRMSPDWDTFYLLSGELFNEAENQPYKLEEYIPAENLPEVLQTISNAIRKKSLFELEHPVFLPDGSIGWTLSRAIPILNEEGEIEEWFGFAEDITKRKKAEQALIESEQRYSALFTNKLNAIAHCRIITDEQGRPVDLLHLQVNEAYEQIMGVKRKDIEGKTTRQIFPSEKESSFSYLKNYGKVALEGKEERFNIYFEQTGQYLDIYAYSPKLGEFIAMFTDVTRKMQAEKALQQSEERFSKAFHNIPIPATIMRVSDDIMTDVNHIFLQMFEYSRDEVINHTSEELHLFRDYNKRMKLNEILERNGYVRDYEFEMLSKTGKLLTLLVSSEATIIREQKYFLTTYFDITERKESERKMGQLSAIIQYSEVAIVSKDLDGNILTWNAGAEKIYGYSAEEIIGKNISILEVSEERSEANRLINKILKNEKIDNFETRRRRKDGTIIPVTINLSPIRSATGAVIGISSISHDISERKQVEEVLLAKNRAETADKMKTNFLLTMSHELRTPLNSIIGFSGILLKKLAGPINSEQEKQLQMVQNSGRHLLLLINDILDIIKIEEGKINPSYETFQFQETIEEVQKLVQPFADSKGLSLNFIKDPSIGTIISDKKRVSQILINLLNNAVKFTENGSVTITCCRDDHTIITEVTDTGIGIRKEDLEKLFNPFMQIENNLTRKYEGSGLGLSITKKLLDLLNGSIKVRSEYGVGSTFTVTLPVGVRAIDKERKEKGDRRRETG